MMKSLNHIFLTGATGFIGSHVADFFCSKKEKISCLTRRNSNLDYLRTLPLNIVYGDITDRDQLRGALKGAKTVIHIAGMVRDWGEYEEFYRANVEGTLNVLKAGYENNIRQFIITGSISSYGEEDCARMKSENSPYNSHYPYFLDKYFPCKMNFYRDTKALTTQEAILFAQEHGLNLTIIEPTWVYGEREFHSGFYEYIHAAKSGIQFMPGSFKNKFHVIYAKDLAEAYYLAYLKKPPGIQRIIVGNESSEKMERIHTIFCRESGVRRPRALPRWLTYPSAFLLEWLYTIFSSKTPPLLTRGRVNMFYDNLEYATSKARDMLLFTNRHTIEEGIHNTVQWYKQQKLI